MGSTVFYKPQLIQIQLVAYTSMITFVLKKKLGQNNNYCDMKLCTSGANKGI